MLPMSCDLPHGDHREDASKTRDCSPKQCSPSVSTDNEPIDILHKPPDTQIEDRPTVDTSSSTLLPELSFEDTSDDLFNDILGYYDKDIKEFENTLTGALTSAEGEIKSGPSLPEFPVDVKATQSSETRPLSSHDTHSMPTISGCSSNTLGMDLHGACIGGDEHAALALPSALQLSLSGASSPLHPTGNNGSLRLSIPPLSRSSTTDPLPSPTVLTTPMDSFKSLLSSDVTRKLSQGASGTWVKQNANDSTSSPLFGHSLGIFEPNAMWPSFGVDPTQLHSNIHRQSQPDLNVELSKATSDLGQSFGCAVPLSGSSFDHLDNVSWMKRMMPDLGPARSGSNMPSSSIVSSTTQYQDPFGNCPTRSTNRRTFDIQSPRPPAILRLESSFRSTKRKRSVLGVTDEHLPLSDAMNATVLPPRRKTKRMISAAKVPLPSTSGLRSFDFSPTPSKQETNKKPSTRNSTEGARKKPRKILIDRSGKQISLQTVIDILDLRRHFSPTHEFRCLFPYCSETFSSSCSLRHFRGHLQELGCQEKGPYRCVFCAKTYRNLTGLCRHLREYHLRAIGMYCASCGATISRATKEQIERHLFSSAHAYVQEALGLRYAFLQPGENSDVDTNDEEEVEEEEGLEDEFQEGSSTGRCR